MISVMGASGNVGSKVADLLLREEQDVRVFGRSAERLKTFGHRGAEVVVGDAINVNDLRVLFRGAGAALLVLPEDLTDPNFISNRSAMSQAITQAIRDQDVGHVVLASAVGAYRDQGVGPAAGLQELEGLLFTLDGPHVLSRRAAWYMENLLANIPMIQEQGINGSAIKGDHKFPMIATADVAEGATQHLLSRDFTGHTVEVVLGPEDVSMIEATRALARVLGISDLPYVEFPPEGVKAALREMGISEEVAMLLVEGQIAINEDRLLGGVERTLATITATRLDEFLKTVGE